RQLPRVGLLLHVSATNHVFPLVGEQLLDDLGLSDPLSRPEDLSERCDLPLRDHLSELRLRHPDLFPLLLPPSEPAHRFDPPCMACFALSNWAGYSSGLKPPLRREEKRL